MKRWAPIAATILAAVGVRAGGETVLLQNGGLLTGRVERVADEVILYQEGGLIRLRAGQVAHVGQNPLAAYDWLRRTRIAADGPSDGHLALAAWAIDQGLWPQAARELLDARQRNPGSRRLELLERRFDELTRPRAAKPSRPPVPSVVVASFEAPVDAASSPLPRIPDGSLEFFTRRVQPLLRHGCATAGCHRGGEDDSLPLDESWLRGHADARSTTHNLRTVLEQVDLGSPEKSRLIAAATGPHHGVVPIRGPRRDEQLAKLAQWVREIAAMNSTDASSSPGSTNEEPPTGPTAYPPIRQDAAVTPATYEPAPLVRGGLTQRVGPRDEFDPAIFNERFRRPEDDLPLSETRSR